MFKTSRITQLTNKKRMIKDWEENGFTCKAYLNMRIISWRPSPFRKRSLLALYINEEHRQLKRFSMNSNSSEVVGSYRLYSCNGVNKYWLEASGTEMKRMYRSHLEDVYVPDLKTQAYERSCNTTKFCLKLVLQFCCAVVGQVARDVAQYNI